MQQRSQDIKALAHSLGMDLCGIASAERLNAAPEGTRPGDILPGCKSVIVVGVRLLDGIVQVNFRAREDGRADLKGLYGTYAYSMLPNFELTYACYAVAQHIERNYGTAAAPMSTGPMTNGKQVSIRHCAVAAGIGEFGWMSIVLTPEFGPRNRFGVILTTEELEPDSIYNGRKLCNPEKCGICAKVCPAGAISGYGDEAKSCELGGRTYTYANVSMPRCHSALMQLRKEYGGSEDLVPKDPTPEQVADAQIKAQRPDWGLQHTGSHYCGLCLSYCPAGNWKQHLSQFTDNK
jgi:epoxyqueuosine reductase QueG